MDAAYTAGIWKALGYLFVAAIVAWFYGMGAKGLELKELNYDEATKDFWKRIFVALGTCLVIAWAMVYVFPTSSGCSQDDGCSDEPARELSIPQQHEGFAYYTLLTFIPFAAGANAGRKGALMKRRIAEREEKEKSDAKKY